MDYQKSIIWDATEQKVAQLKLGNKLTDDEIVQQTIQDMDLTEGKIA